MIACSSTIGATMMISERPNSPRGRKRLRDRRQACTRPCAHRSSADPGDQHVANPAHRLQIQRQLGVFLDLAAQARHLHVDGAFQRHIQPLAQFAAARRAAPHGWRRVAAGRLPRRSVSPGVPRASAARWRDRTAPRPCAPARCGGASGGAARRSRELTRSSSSRGSNGLGR